MVVLAIAAIAPLTAASAASPAQIFADCASSRYGGLTHAYSVKDLTNALHRAQEGDIGEYSSCPDAVRDALTAALSPPRSGDGDDGRSQAPATAGGGGTGGDNGGGSVAPGGGAASTEGSANSAPSSNRASGHSGIPARTPAGTQQPAPKSSPHIPTATPAALTDIAQAGSFGDNDRSLPRPLLWLLLLLAVMAVLLGAATSIRRWPWRPRA
jgi:hypothetical protein